MTFLTRRFVLPLVAMMCLVWPSPFVFAQDSYQTATVISVRQIRHMGSLGPSRFAHTIYFTVDFALRLPAESYCVGYETPVLDEVQDLIRRRYQITMPVVTLDHRPDASRLRTVYCSLSGHGPSKASPLISLGAVVKTVSFPEAEYLRAANMATGRSEDGAGFHTHE